MKRGIPSSKIHEGATTQAIQIRAISRTQIATHSEGAFYPQPSSQTHSASTPQ